MGGKPKRDVTGDDGMTISVGDASLRIVTMPGHTPGTLSYLFEMRDHGKPLRSPMWAARRSRSMPMRNTMTATSRRRGKWRRPLPITAPRLLLSNHTEFDDAFFKAHAADDRKNGEANPFDVGADACRALFCRSRGLRRCRQIPGYRQIEYRLNVKNVVLTVLPLCARFCCFRGQSAKGE